MTKHCSKGDKARVTYQFKGQGKKVYESKNAPVDVVTTNLGSVITSQNFAFSDDGSVITSYSHSCKSNIKVSEKAEIWLISCGFDDWGEVGSFSTGYGLGVGYSKKPIKVGSGQQVTMTVHNERKPWCNCSCALEWRLPDSEQCQIQITDSKGGMFTDKGKCPVDYWANCGSQCPPGQTKVDQPGEPGYCCIDCKALAAQVNALGQG